MAANKTVQRRTKRPESRRQELLEAALKLFVEHGVTEPTVADITDAAGAAKGTFYRYFESKDDLIAALQEDYTDELSDLLSQRIEAAAPDGRWAQIEALIDASSEFYRRNAQVHHLLFRIGNGHDEMTVREGHTARPYIVMRDLIEAGVHEGAFSCEDVELTSYLLFSALHAALDLEVASSEIGHDRLVRGMVDVFFKTMQPLSRPAAAGRGRRRPLFARATTATEPHRAVGAPASRPRSG